jgi:hypothetical protein
MTSQQTIVSEIEKYIRETIANNNGSFNREAILIKSKEWMEKFPVEFNSILNMIENEGRNSDSDFIDDSIPSIHYCGNYADDSIPSIYYGGNYADDSTPSVAYGGYADDSIPSIHYGGNYADDSIPSVAYGGYADDSTPSVAHHDEYSGNIMPDHMSSVSDSPMGSDHIDSSPSVDQDDDSESDMPLQRTMSCAPPRKQEVKKTNH